MSLILCDLSVFVYETFAVQRRISILCRSAFLIGNRSRDLDVVCLFDYYSLDNRWRLIEPLRCRLGHDVAVSLVALLVLLHGGAAHDLTAISCHLGGVSSRIVKLLWLFHLAIALLSVSRVDKVGTSGFSGAARTQDAPVVLLVVVVRCIVCHGSIDACSPVV